LKLKEFMDRHDIGDVVIWTDDTVGYDVEFPITEQLYSNRKGTSKLINYLTDKLTVEKLHNDNHVSINLYEFLDNENIIDYVKNNIDDNFGYESHEKNVKRLTVDVINYIVFGANKYCDKLLHAFIFADLLAEPSKKARTEENYSISNFNDFLVSVSIPIGNIIVRVKTDSNYPGIYVDLRGENIRDGYEENTVNLAVIEYDMENRKMQTIVYGDSLRDDPSVIIEHGNYKNRSVDNMINSAIKKNEQMRQEKEILNHISLDRRGRSLR